MYPAPFEVRVDAARWNPADPLAAGVLSGWLHTLGVAHSFPSGTGPDVLLAIVGVGTAMPGDWIVRGSCGIYICPDATFERKYRLMEPTETGEVDMPQSKSVGNTDNSKRGRDIEPKSTGRPSKSGRLSGKQADPKTIGPDDYEGHKVGRRGK